jgi:hypothetical protein
MALLQAKDMGIHKKARSKRVDYPERYVLCMAVLFGGLHLSRWIFRFVVQREFAPECCVVFRLVCSIMFCVCVCVCRCLCLYPFRACCICQYLYMYCVSYVILLVSVRLVHLVSLHLLSV